MNPNNNLTNKHNAESEIDLIALSKKAWENRNIIIKTTLWFMLFGFFVAILTPKEFTVSTTMVPQVADGKKIGGNLSGLAAMAGINLGSMGGDSGISPTLYPQIINSIPFQKELLQTPLSFIGFKEKISFAEYYINYHNDGIIGTFKKYTIGLPGVIFKALKGTPKNNFPSLTHEGIYLISEDEKELIETLNEQIGIDVNIKDGYITISATMPEALAAAELAKKTQNLLQQYIINFKIQKSSDQLKFIEERFLEKELKFKSKQLQLARFSDRNQFVNSAQAQTTLVGLQSEYDIAEKVYSELAKQLETQQLQVKEDTPVFTILKPVAVPVKKTKPDRILILLVFTFLGFIIGTSWVLGKDYLNTLRNHWKKIGVI
ncbi:MAG: GNVR domain-containing protein [Flavobacteriaceae bacterium]|nr:GNVR domain-containing protein [Flavobacteriaceae bacterium]